MQREFPALECAFESRLEAEARLRTFVHRRVEEREPAAADAFRAVHGDARLAQQCFLRRGVARVHGDADARGEGDRRAVGVGGRHQRPGHALGHDAGVLRFAH